MKRTPKITLGTVNPATLKKPGAARYLTEKFTDDLVAAMHEAKKTALRKQQVASPSAA